MFYANLMRLMVLHAGTPVEISQATLMLMFVVLGLLLNGIGFGRIVKTKESLLHHRWIISAAIVLTALAIFLVMLPSAFRFYIDPDVMIFSKISITTIVHGVIGVPAVVTALLYAFGDLPVKIRKWMRITAVLWIADLIFGLVLYLQMMELL
jgi:uncharacterized membrane protein YozB (DUF420 family)